jgi:alpha-tubulin suppressor-like RCC1 family protein
VTLKNSICSDSSSTSSCYGIVPVGLTGARDVVGGQSHSCALLESGQVKCWGSNEFGQIGSGATSTDDITDPTDVKDLADVDQISAGDNHTCASTRGQVWCWGSNASGQLGVSSATLGEARAPVLVQYSQ